MAQRWPEVLTLLAGVAGRAGGPARIVVAGPDPSAVTETTARLASALRTRPSAPDTVTIDGSGTPVELTIWLRTSRTSPTADSADVVVDLHDRDWPVVRHVNPALLDHASWYLRESRAFFGIRAATWDAKFGDDAPAYAAAVRRAAIPRGSTVLDAGCGTGRALPPLREAVGPTGRVLGLDHTPEMLEVARKHGEPLLMADARHLPFAASALDAVFAAGLIMHLPSPADGLRELARATAESGRLVLFHPTSRAALAARHGRTLLPDDPLSHHRLEALCAATGWTLTDYDDGGTVFFALARRTG
ncbi:methyltransferase domain-containing protein [Dactylosporangium sp. NPDC051485]|uniref:class I SAM-dependent methyltransferase n=1 Tax=Dactylosporangium sp. NPDC051485 TaxID=3154846 RepID=UPI00343EDA4F